MKRNLESGYNSMTGVSLNLFTEDNMRQMHLATMELLSEMGVKVLSKEARDVLGGKILPICIYPLWKNRGV